MGKLTDRVAVITGATSGIGRAKDILFAQEGAKVVIQNVGGIVVRESFPISELWEAPASSSRRIIPTPRQYRFVNEVPVRRREDALQVNWCEITIIREDNGKRLYHNASSPITS